MSDSFFSFRDWKDMAITQVILKEFKTRRDQAIEELATSAGLDPAKDRFTAGRIASYTEFLDITEETLGD